MIRIVGTTYVLLLAGLVFGLYHVSYLTDLMVAEAERVSDEIRETRDTVGILQAEWSARTSPEYIEGLTQKFLPTLRPTQPEQIVSLSDLPARDSGHGTDESIDRLIALVELRESSPRPRPRL